jgi:putative tricarboxylic transport membrane protein
MQHQRQTRYRTAGQAALAVIAFCLAVAPAHAQAWKPDKPVELIAASGPGGNTDKLARTIQRILQDEKLVLVPINVVNKTGGNQTISRVYLNQFAGDGHYMELSNPTLISNNVMGITAQQPGDFSPLVLLLDEYTVFSVRADAPYKSGGEMMRRLAQQPDSISIGLTTRGGANHIALALAAKASGVDLKRLKIVSFKSNGESMTALLGGHIDLVASSASPAVPHFQQGRTRIVAISAPKRMSGALAQVPTLKEQQIAAVNSNWRALIGPKGLQLAQIAYWEDAAARLAKTDRWKKELEANFWEHHLLHGQALREFLSAETKETREIFAELGLAK